MRAHGAPLCPLSLQVSAPPYQLAQYRLLPKPMSYHGAGSHRIYRRHPDRCKSDHANQHGRQRNGCGWICYHGGQGHCVSAGVAASAGVGSVTTRGVNNIAVDGQQITTDIGAAQAVAGAVVQLSGVEITAAVGTTNVYGQIDTGQTPDYATINDSQTPSFSAVSTSQSPSFSTVNDSQTPSFSEINTSQSPGYTELDAGRSAA